MARPNRTLLARFSRRLAQDNQSIDCFDSPTFSKDGKRIDIDRFNLIGEIARQLRQPYERITYCFQVTRHTAAKVSEQARALELRQYVFDIGSIHRTKSQRHIVQELGQDTAKAD